MKILIANLRYNPDNFFPGTHHIEVFLETLRKTKNIKMDYVGPFSTRKLCANHIFYSDKPFRDIQAPMYIKKFVRTVTKLSTNYEIIEIHLPNPAFGYIADIIKRDTKRKIIVYYNSSLFRTSYLTYEIARYHLLTFLKKLTLNNKYAAKFCHITADLYIVATQFQKKELIKLGYEQKLIKVIPNTTNQAIFKQRDKNIARMKLSLPRNKTIVGFAGHFNVGKGTELMIKSVNEMRNTSVLFAIAWSGKGKATIAKTFRDNQNVKFFSEKINMPEFLSAVDILVLPYNLTCGSQMQPQLLLEALSIGVPLITTNIPPIIELLQNNVHAILCDPTSEEVLSKLKKFLSRPDKLNKKMIREQKKLFRYHLSEEQIRNHFLEAYSHNGKKD